MHSLLHVRSRTALALALCMLSSASVFAQSRKAQKIEFSEPTPSSSSIVVSNLDREASEESKLKPLPKQVFRPSDFFPQENNQMPMRFQSFQPRMDKKTMEALEKRRNWAFTDSEALYSDKTLEEMFGVKSGTESLSKSLTPVEKYYESLQPKRKVGTSHNGDILDLDQARNFSTNGAATFGHFQSENDALLKKAFSSAYENPYAPKQSGSVATFATPAYIPPSQDRAQQQQLEFRKMLSQSSAPITPALAGQSNLKPNAGLNAPGLAKSSIAEEQRSALNPFLGVAKAPVFRPEILRDPTAKALGLPDPSLLPKPEVKKPLPVSPLASPLPVRKF